MINRILTQALLGVAGIILDNNPQLLTKQHSKKKVKKPGKRFAGSTTKTVDAEFTIVSSKIKS